MKNDNLDYENRVIIESCNVCDYCKYDGVFISWFQPDKCICGNYFPKGFEGKKVINTTNIK
jgi:hypothetical protein